MRLSAQICRQQELIQLTLSQTDPLESRRKVAAAAAKAWALEAELAEKRESGVLDPLDRLDAEITQEFADELIEEEDAAHHNHDPNANR
jgi:hypothetical protein